MADAAGGSPNENPTVRYEETLAIRDDEGAGSLVGRIRILVATRGVATRIGGMGVLQEFAGRLVADQTVVVAASVLAGVLFLIIGVTFVWLFVKNVGRAHGPAIYVGSDRPQELAGTIARQVPGNVTARPF